MDTLHNFDTGGEGGLEACLTLLDRTLAQLGSVLVAYSGGTDSAFLAHAAHRVLGPSRMLAVIADSPSLPRAELAAAITFAKTHGIPLRVLATHEFENPDYVRNDRNRCFHCKDELFSRMSTLLAETPFQHFAFGMNLDDDAPAQAAVRPGQQAAARHGVVAPLVTACLTKPAVRALARRFGLSLADKPASACLSSRIAYGLPVTPPTLLQIETAESSLHALGFPQVRVRHLGTHASIEIALEDLPRAFDEPLHTLILNAVIAAGFPSAVIDPAGYRSGSLNLLPIAAIKTEGKLTVK